MNKPKMMPGQEPYSAEELKKLHQLVSDAADDDPGEENESVEESFEEDKKERRLMVPFMERVSSDRARKGKREKAVKDKKDAWWKKQMEIYNSTTPSGLRKKGTANSRRKGKED